ncbi:MAG: molecular chaperone HscC [Lachnospiraceae bacterium]|nr:molecular chaperone HscC [Lachnospiraceae bacterium]
MAIIGIDLGTTNSLACIYQGDKPVLIPNPFGETLTPSVVSIGEDGQIYVGSVAKERLVSHPEASASSFKRHMGTDKSYTLAGQDFSPQDLSSFVLRQLKEDAERFLGEEVTEAVISVPAYFNDNQRFATKEAGKLAGLKVERLVNEPSAAALAASRISGDEEGSYLVFDFGGGTLDVSVVDYFDNVVEIIAVSGDNRLGGNDFDEIIARCFCQQNKMDFDRLSPQQRASLLQLSEKCKRELTTQNQAELIVEPENKKLAINNLVLAQLSQGIFDRISQVVANVLRDSGRDMEGLDEVILVGGSAKMPVVEFYLQTYLKKKPCIIGSPDEVVAMGAGTYAGVKERKKQIRDLVLTDICPFTLGTDVFNSTDVNNSLMSPIIERNSILPCSKTGLYTNPGNYQSHITIGIYQGEEYYSKDNVYLGDIKMEIRPVPKHQACIEVCFTYDINGILEVEVTDHGSKQVKKKVLTSNSLRMSEAEVEQRLKQLQAFKLAPPGGIRTKLVLARGERLFSQLLGVRRQAVSHAMGQLQSVLQSQNDQQIANALIATEAVFDQLEGVCP